MLTINEILFIHPEFFRKDLGRKLLAFTIHHLKAEKVDVNQPKQHAVKIFENFGFKVFKRSDRDDHGKDYPVLRMKHSNE
ncbi:MAG TPA: GNAT family N-acetyltransferase [Saprospiraceae bacterium]|nr:GNAT family N-acetyltransferase [Saprospiraceae bacterium]